LERVEELVADARAVNPDLEAYSFINRADHQGSYNEETREVLTDSDHIEFISPTLGDRKAFAIAFDYGQSITEYTPRDRKAIAEMKTLYGTVFETAPE
jgi:chromosome partitioning protein